MQIELYSRPGCHLCEKAKEVIVQALRRHHFEFIERNVEHDPKWEAEYGCDIPVVLIDGRKAFKHSVAPRALERYFSR
jgi:glutaredoxin